MKRKLSFITVLFILACPSFVTADAPKLINEGFEVYEKSGYQAAFEFWKKTSNWKDDQSFRKALKGLQDFEITYGAFQNYDLFRSISIGPRLNIYYIVAYFENAPLYFYFVTYQKSSGEVIFNKVNFNSDIKKIWPSSILYEN